MRPESTMTGDFFNMVLICLSFSMRARVKKSSVVKAQRGVLSM